MTRADIAAGLHLCRLSNWNQLEEDWIVFLECGGAFLAEENGAVIGSVAHLPFGNEFTWLSMMLVDPAARRAGVGTRLMATVLDAIGEGVCVRLDATPFGEPLYRRFGFEDEYRLARTRVEADPERHRASPDARRITPADLPSIVERDQAVFGADRSALLADFLRRAPDFAWQSDRAYCFGRPGHMFPQIGPIVAEDLASAREILAHCLARSPGQTIVVDLPCRPDGLGFTPDRPFLRMRRGTAAFHESPGAVYAIAGPEFG